MNWLAERLTRSPSRKRALGELRELRRRLMQLCGPRKVSVAEREHALRLRALREAVLHDIGPVDACARCVERGVSAPGAAVGGICCGRPAEVHFDEDELAILRAVGMRPRHFKLPREPRPGCLFRGAKGCSLAPAYRPSKCVMYLCTDLKRELHAAGRLDGLEAQCEALSTTWEQFRALRRDRLEEIFVRALTEHL